MSQSLEWEKNPELWECDGEYADLSGGDHRPKGSLYTVFQ